MSEEKASITEELTAVLEEIVEGENQSSTVKGENTTQLTETDFLIGARQYQLVTNHREGFQLEKLGERYSEVLARYDYIVGDWGYEQLRLKGFFEIGNKKALPEQKIDTLEDYLYEYCNFGCAYFVLACLDKSVTKGQPHRRQGHREAGQRSETIKPVHRQTPPTNRRNSQNNKHKPRSAKAEKPYTEKTTRPTKIRGDQAKTINQTQPRKRHFTIRRRETNKK